MKNFTPDNNTSSLNLNEKLLLQQISSLGDIGLETPNKGRTRIALSKDEKLGRDQIVRWMEELDLDIKIDPIGNIFGTLSSNNDKEQQPLMMGSHIDTVKNAGALDGCYGVLAGIAVIRAFKDAQLVPSRPITVVAFTNEEGVRYHPDMMGSLVFAKGLDMQTALATVGTDGSILKDELKRIGYYGDFDSSTLIPYKYIELHIEQGPILDTDKIEIGDVENLQGIS
ncbi:MAG: M20/M25/M40 family metallo-hydrolase, partial [Campylobacteraceae bacterium]|nr:M20/M25/M40 family metallo-hydrolase [Campylobacteraceae bacterium]